MRKILRNSQLAMMLGKSSLSEIWSLLDKRDTFVLKIVMVFQALLSFLDLIVVALIGVIGALSVYGIQSQDAGTLPKTVIDALGIGSLTFQNQIIILSALTISILSAKTIASLWITRRSLSFISRRGAKWSGILVRNLLTKTSSENHLRSSQELIYSATSGVQYISVGILGLAASTVADLSLLIILSVGLFVYNPILSTITFSLFLSVGISMSIYLRKKAFKVGSIEADCHVKSNEVLIEVLDTYRESVVRDTRENYSQNFENLRMKVAGALARRTFMPFASKYVMEVSMIVGAFLVAGVQFALYDARSATAGLAIFLGASSRIAPAILRIQQAVTQITTYLGQSHSTLELLRNRDPLDQESKSSKRRTEPDFDAAGFYPEVTVENLEFQYKPGSEFKLSIAQLRIEPNQHIAVVGSSGSGKSTLIDLLLGILEPNAGAVLISGVKPNLTFKRWPGAVGYVPQTTVVTSGTIIQNIALGYDSKEVNLPRIKKCLELSGLHEFTNESKMGLYLDVGDSGHKLSGGQKQRIGISRALYTNPKLLVMDESTSSLDSKTEYEITQALANLKHELTLITIAHRLSTVQSADLVLYLQNGKIIASGSFEQVRLEVQEFDVQANLLGL